MIATFENVFLDDVFYVDFYSIPRFGKTKLGNLVFYGKQAQNVSLIVEAINIVCEKIVNICKVKNINALCFTPHSIKRNVQFLEVVKKKLGVCDGINKVKVQKITGQISVPQKSLSKLKDRIENAKNTIFFNEEKRRFKNVLILDDAVGSGATMNEMAKKIKKQGIADKVFGLAFVGSFKGFDVFKEV